MHAASVNPEPGSNSLKNCISTEEISSSGQHLFQSYFVLASFLLFRVFKVFFNEIFTQSCVRSCFKILLVVQFSKIVRRSEKKGSPLEVSPIIIHHFSSLVNPFSEIFQIFLSIYEYSAKVHFCAPASRRVKTQELAFSLSFPPPRRSFTRI